MIIEVVSPSTFRKDVKEKLSLHEGAGVEEYWLEYPGENNYGL